jgi:hexosaminidase
MMDKLKYALLLLVWTAVFIPALAQTNSRIAIIPQPVQVFERSGVFAITALTKVYSDPAFAEIATLFINQAAIKSAVSKLPKGSSQQINFVLVGKEVVADSAGYRLTVTPEQITVSARTKGGALNGMQSLLQLILLQPKQGIIPCAEIYDHPRFGYRGVMLDVSRHFFPVTYIRRFLDLMALYKMNIFHWHLTDGPGWRLEIKKYPELTSKAAWRTHSNWKTWWESTRRYSEEGNPNAYGGFYTQEQAKEIVAYAAQRGITVIPEIEMPGHSEEVLAVYPNLSCSGKPYINGEFCLGNDSTFVFLQNVLTEVMAIFPSEYIHVGGDEAGKSAWKQCPKCQKRIKDEKLKNEAELQSYAVRRLEQFLTSKGRKLLGWDEIIEGGLAPAAAVMSWRGEKGGVNAAEMGHDVVMTPGGYCYFDSYQADPATQPAAIGGYLTTEKVYSYEPVPMALDPAKAKYILGAQANIWTEYIPTTEHLEFMTFPRLLAMSEVTWSQKENRDYESFKTRMQSHYRMMQRLNVNYCRPSYRLEVGTKFDYNSKKVKVNFKSEQFNPVIYYTVDGSEPTTFSNEYKGSFDLSGSAKLCAAIFEEGIKKDKSAKMDVDFHLAIWKKVIYNRPFSKSYPAQKEATLANGYRGSLSYGDGQWQGFESKDMDVTIDLENPTPLKRLSVSFMQQTGPGVFIPDSVMISLSDNGEVFRKVKTIKNDIPLTQTSLTFKDFQFDLSGESGRFIRVFARNGQHGFLFADEVIVY